MTTAEKIKVFTSIDDILLEIENDRQSNSILNRRYAVRFIMLDNFDVFCEFVIRLTTVGIKSFDIENLLTDDKDRWITQDELKNAIKSITETSIVSPFSEIARFYTDEKFKAFFNEISLLENPYDKLTRRIYIPLIGLQSRFENFLNTFTRIAESAPVWSIVSNKPQKVNLFLVNKTFPENNQGLKTLYEWLRFWKTQAPVEKIVCSSLPVVINSKYSQPDNIFTPIQIESAHDFIEKYYNISLNIPYLESEEKLWQQLLSNIFDNSFKFNQFTKKHFNVQKLTIKDILDKWTDENFTEFDRWLLKHNYLQNLSAENLYLTSILKDCYDYSSLKLFSEVALSIVVGKEYIEYIEERNNLLNLFDKQHNLSDFDLSKLKNQILNIAKSDTEKAILHCTGRFDFEKEMFIDWYKNGKMSLDKLQNLYSDFYFYLSDARCDSWVNAYIQAYKQAKIEDKYTEDVRNYIIEKNANEDTFYQWYHCFESSKEFLAMEKPDKVFWIDGLGIEYLSLIQKIVNSSNFKIKKLQIAKTGIPSSTEHNKFENVEKINDLDRFTHDNSYQYQQTICKEIDIVKNIFKKILNQTTEITIAIVSDHGLTALSRVVDSKKYNAKASHEGRYIKLDSTDCLEDSDYIRCKNGEDNFKVALTHASLNTKPVREVHGGCTPEEILVPFILISNKKENIDRIATPIFKQDIPEKTVAKQTAGFEEEELF